MRKIAFLLCVIFSVFVSELLSQTTENFNYQAVVRNNDGELLSNQSINVQLTIIESTADGTELYREAHTVTTSDDGQINLAVGNGTSDLGSFESIDWGAGSKFIKVEIDAGDGFVDLGTFQLLSVPYALYAKDVENKDDADADPENEIQDLSLVDDVLTITNHPSPTQVNLAPFTGNNTDEQELSLDGDTLKITNGNQVVLPYDSSKWVIDGSTMYYNDGKVGIGSSKPVSNLEVKATTVSSEALFQVINSNNDTVFAVYPDGVKIFVDSEAKGKVGGFAISGRSPNKASGGVDILKVTVDSTRIYVSDTVSAKGKVGGFAISGRSPNKGINNDYLVITGDSTRIYVNDTSTVKGKVGGFAISGRSPNKGAVNDYLRVTRDSTRVYVTESAAKGKVGGFAISGRSPNKGLLQDYFNITPNTTAQKILNESRIMWYPEKSALLAGEINVTDPDSVGEYSMALGYRNHAIGNWSQAMGQSSIARGPYSTAIGFEAVADTNSFAFGTGSKALGYNSFAFGSVGLDSLGNTTASYTTATGDYSFAFGLGAEAVGTGSFVLGTNCSAIGDFSTAAGFQTEASGFGSTAMGGKNIASGHYSLAFGSNNQAQGYASVAFGLSNAAEGLQSFVAGRGNTVTGVSAVALGIANIVTGDGAFVAGNLNNATQTNAIAFGNNNTASGSNSFATGTGNVASGNGAIAAGSGTTASGDFSLVIGSGSSTTANGDAAFAAGYSNTASGQASLVSGYSTEASGNYSTAFGYQNAAPAYCAFVIGQYTESTTANSSTSWNTSDPVFVIGNGTGGAPSGNIGTINDAFVVYKNGNAKLEGNFYPNVDNAYDLGTSGNRWSDIYATNGTILTSDSRLKTNVEDLTYGLNEILELRPVTFLWKDNTEKGTRLGLIAQEVQPVIKEVVNVGDDEDETLGLRYTELIPVLIKSIQDQQKIIDKQSEKNKELEMQIKELNERLILLEEKSK